MKDFLLENGIEYFALIPIQKCKVIKEYLLTKNGFDACANVITMLLPYRTELKPTNISVYASVMDYHEYVKCLSEALDEYAAKNYPNKNLKLFADHSPIDEVHAACISGLGFIGDNGLLINKKYSSFVFLAECVTDLTPKELGMEYATDTTVKECLHCGACSSACPVGCIKTVGSVDNSKSKAMCLSAITQKKGELSEDEINLMLNNNTVWGCDICQNACPYTKNAEFSKIEFFQKNIITTLNRATLDKMSDEEFMSRPFSWRGRTVIERNLKYCSERGKEW